MLKKLLGYLWRITPRRVRYGGIWLTTDRFTVTAGAAVLDERGRVLLLKHVFRDGSGWGMPGGFIERGEQPEEALRRELREEAGLELDHVEIVLARTVPGAKQIELIYRCRANGQAVDTQSYEVSRAGWFRLDALPPGLTKSQRRLIKRALEK